VDIELEGDRHPRRQQIDREPAGDGVGPRGKDRRPKHGRSRHVHLGDDRRRPVQLGSDRADPETELQQDVLALLRPGVARHRHAPFRFGRAPGGGRE
jgi:hypothetical protein